MKNTNKENVEKILNGFVQYVDMVNSDQCMNLPYWMKHLGHQIGSRDFQKDEAGKIYATLRKGLILEYGPTVAQHVLNNAYQFN